MNFADLKTEFSARGTDYLEEDAESVARAERWLNQAYREILNFQPWPFLQTSVTGDEGAGFVDVPDLRRVRFVVDLSNGPASGRPLQRVAMDDLAAEGEDFSATGTPQHYYVDGGTVVRAHPAGGTIRVYYIRRAPALSGTDEPLFSDEYHDLIVDRAMIKAYKDSDNFEAAAALRQEFNVGLSAMVEDYQRDSREVHFIPVDPYDG
jgi:hypothetical protein